MRHLLGGATILILALGLSACTDNSSGQPWDLDERGDTGNVQREDAGVDDTLTGTDTADPDTGEDTGRDTRSDSASSSDWVIEATPLATALNRIAITAEHRQRAECVRIVLVSPASYPQTPDIEMPDDWAVEGLGRKAAECPDETWPQDFAGAESASGVITFSQETSRYGYPATIGVDLEITFPQNDAGLPRTVHFTDPDIPLSFE